MPSPFPGMDPYLECHWGDIQHSLVVYASDQLQSQLPKPLVARIAERQIVESACELKEIIVPNSRLGKLRRVNRPTAKPSTRYIEPLVIFLDESMCQPFIEIREHNAANRLVTVVEILCPANKVRGPGQDLYLQQQHDLQARSVSSVEIDLLREGRRLWLFPAERLPLPYRTPYQVCVRRGWEASVEFYSIPLRKRLPTIKIPLRPDDEDARLDLQALIEMSYRNGAYEKDLDYRANPDPPLTEKDARWAAALLRNKRLRRSHG
jgi:hypothetical protein